MAHYLELFFFVGRTESVRSMGKYPRLALSNISSLNAVLFFAMCCTCTSFKVPTTCVATIRCESSVNKGLL